MEPIVAGGLVLGMTFGTLVFVGLCNAIANRLYSRYFDERRAETVPLKPQRGDTEQRRSA